jgi:hypothetical protein
MPTPFQPTDRISPAQQETSKGVPMFVKESSTHLPWKYKIERRATR